MLFNSKEFFYFFIGVVTIYFSIPHKYRWAWLLIASYYFYMAWNPIYSILILLYTVITYFFALQIGKTDKKSERKIYLSVALFITLLILFIFKYFNFFSDFTNSILNLVNSQRKVSVLDVLLPVGISFYTFQTMSYLIDVYRKEKEPEHHFGKYALYVSFFPQLVAGPIERSTRLMPQFFEKHEFEYDRAVSGLRLMLWGFFKKLVIADRSSIIVDSIYNSPGGHTGPVLIIATYLFAFQIYCDFSGYSDIAIGTARILGYDLMENFRRPYFSKSVIEFWRKWHISLSTWFRDYLYIPMGGNRVPKIRWVYNIIVVFLITGFWHGANWTFLVWGGLHGLFLLINNFISFLKGIINWQPDNKYVSTGLSLLSILITFHVVTFCWIFFRAKSLSDSLYIVKHLFIWKPLNINDFGVTISELAILIIAIILMEVTHVFQEISLRMKRQISLSRPVRWALYYSLIVMIVVFGVFDQSAFIYFQF